MKKEPEIRLFLTNHETKFGLILNVYFPTCRVLAPRGKDIVGAFGDVVDFKVNDLGARNASFFESFFD